MSLAYEVLRFVDRATKRPADASDPRLLARLEAYARDAWEGIVALHAPASPMTWEVVTVLRGAVQLSNRVSFRFPRPVEIVGFYPTIIPLATPTTTGILTPTTNTIAVSMDTDNQNYLTSGDGISTPAGGTAGPFVTLASMSVQVPRIVGYKLRNPTPDIGFTYRWKRDAAGGVGTPPAVYFDTLISLAMYARYL
jgi:hypothetical protein